MSHIPKIIHYCWFGRNPLPKQYVKYIESWRKYMPDYEIKEWNEDNYDVNCIPFSAEAYELGKYAYVSDYARLRILYEQGGVYLDTDVELIKPLDNILAKGGFMGFEKNTNAPAGQMLNVAPGLGFAVPPKHPIIREILNFYENHHFRYPDGRIEQITIVSTATDVLRQKGLCQSETPSTIEGITIYPWDYFCPVEFLSNKLEITENTHAIHHYSASWMSLKDKLMMLRGYYANKIRKIFKRKR